MHVQGIEKSEFLHLKRGHGFFAPFPH